MAPNAHVEMQTPSTNEIRRPFMSFGHSGGNKLDQRAWETEERGWGRAQGMVVRGKQSTRASWSSAIRSSTRLFPQFPPPRGKKQRGTGTGDRTTPFPLQIPPKCIALSVCVCVCVQVAAVGKQWCGHSHAGSAHGSDKVPTEQFPPFSGRRWWTGRHRLKRAPRGSVQQGLGREAEKENQTGRGKEEDGVVRKRTG